MNRQLKKRQEELEEEQERLNYRMEHFNKLKEIWDFYQSDESHKFINYPTLQELEKYDNDTTKRSWNPEAYSDKLEFDLEYLEYLLKEVENYDFVVNCPLNDELIAPFQLEGMQVNEKYKNKLKHLHEKVKRLLKEIEEDNKNKTM